MHPVEYSFHTFQNAECLRLKKALTTQKTPVQNPCKSSSLLHFHMLASYHHVFVHEGIDDGYDVKVLRYLRPLDMPLVMDAWKYSLVSIQILEYHNDVHLRQSSRFPLLLKAVKYSPNTFLSIARTLRLLQKSLKSLGYK